MMMIMSARGWVSLCQHLLSHFLPEANRLGEMIRQELKLAAPRMIRHAREVLSIRQGILHDFESLSAESKSAPPSRLVGEESCDAPATPRLEIYPPLSTPGSLFADDLAYHDNRYAWVGSNLRRTSVRFGWSAVSFAEIRDLNRHRTGSKWSPQIPQGFYFAEDQLRSIGGNLEKTRKQLKSLASVGARACADAHSLLGQGSALYLYWTLLGTQYSFEHLTTADKFLYEAELRTGIGTHYRYATHLREVLKIWYARFPETKGFILEGSAEPE
jgi:hypothetical protein